MIRMNDRFRLFIAVLCAVVLVVSGSLPAARAAASSPQIDAVLVLDVSHSMSNSDPGSIGNEAMKLFIDMLSAKGDRSVSLPTRRGSNGRRRCSKSARRRTRRI